MNVVLEERGGINVLLAPLVVSVLFFFGALGFGIWAYMERTDYKDNVDQKVAAAVEVAKDKTSTDKDNEFLEKEKEPLREYKAPSIYGSITFMYPKTWSGYTEDSSGRFKLLMSKGIVSGNARTAYALRVAVEETTYDSKLKSFDSQLKTGKIKASAIRLNKVKSVLGTRIDGEIASGVNGSLIVLPLRDKTILISAEAEEYVPDLDKIILPSFTFSP